MSVCLVVDDCPSARPDFSVLVVLTPFSSVLATIPDVSTVRENTEPVLSQY
jgi:hypothetical protein